jgi:hypothetical protein
MELHNVREKPMVNRRRYEHRKSTGNGEITTERNYTANRHVARRETYRFLRASRLLRNMSKVHNDNEC